MSKTVLDASAILAWLFNETGAEAVQSILEAGMGVISSVNYAEVASKLVDRDMPEAAVQTVLSNLDIEIIGHDEQQALLNGELRRISKAYGLSLGDRACLALGLTTNLPVLTCDRCWQNVPIALEIQWVC